MNEHVCVHVRACLRVCMCVCVVFTQATLQADAGERIIQVSLKTTG